MKKFNRFLSLTFLTILLSMSVAVMGQNPFTIDVIQPDNTSIDWVIGESYTISWTDNLPGPVEIYLWNPNIFVNPTYGAWMELSVASDPAGIVGSTWTWDISDTLTPSTGYKVRVWSKASPTTYQNAGVTFELIDAPANSITVLQPTVTGISWAWNTTHLISWTDNIDEPVKVEVSDNTGAAGWQTILNGASVIGTSISWTVPSSLSKVGVYRIRVSSTVYPTTVTAQSLQTFTITEATGSFQEIYQPNSNLIEWGKTSTHIISWRDDMNEPVDIYVYDILIPGSKYLIGDDVVGSTFEWNLGTNWGAGGIAWVPGNKYKLELRSSVDEDIIFPSEYFYITEPVGEISAIYQPLDNTSWTVGTTHLISWLDNLEEAVNIYYNNIGGSSDVLITTGGPVQGTTYAWTIPATGLVTGVNKMQIVIKSSIDVTELKESYLFDLTETTGTTMNIIQPDVGGIVWAFNSEHYISWDDDLLEGENVDIDLIEYTNSGAGTPIGSPYPIAENVVGSTYVWDIDGAVLGGGPVYDAGDYYKIKVYSHDDPTNANLIDYSSSTFEISASIGNFITVNQPNDADYWMNLTTHLIAWDDDCVGESFKIYLHEYGWNGANWVEITPGGTYPYELNMNAGTGSSWAWPINQTILTPGNSFRVEVQNALDETLYGLSGYFYIVPFGKSVTSIGDIAGDIAANVVIYPNPTSGQFSVSAPGNIDKVEVRNLLGQVLYSGVETTIDVVSYEAGLYIVNIEVEGQVIAKKLFVQ